MKNSGNIFIGMIAAATAGVLIGMLIAPEKGEDLRRRIRSGAGDWSKKLFDMLDNGKAQLDEFQDEVIDLKNHTTESLKKEK